MVQIAYLDDIAYPGIDSQLSHSREVVADLKLSDHPMEGLSRLSDKSLYAIQHSSRWRLSFSLVNKLETKRFYCEAKGGLDVGLVSRRQLPISLRGKDKAVSSTPVHSLANAKTEL
jgi:hypothetical protein